MSLSKTLSETDNYVVGKLSGVVDANELTDFLFWIIQQYKAENLRNNYRVLIDATDADNIQMNETDVQRISHINRTYVKNRGHIKTGIAVNTETGKKLARLHKILSKSVDIEVMVFDTRQSACNWLEITPDY